MSSPQERQLALGIAVANDDASWAANLMALGARADSDHLARALYTGGPPMVSILFRHGARFDNLCAQRVLDREAPGCFAQAMIPSARSMLVSQDGLGAACQALARRCSPERQAFAEALLARARPELLARQVRQLAEAGQALALERLIAHGAPLNGQPSHEDEPLTLATPLEACFQGDSEPHRLCAQILARGGCALAIRRINKNGNINRRGAQSASSLANLLRACDARGWEELAIFAAEAACWPAWIAQASDKWARLPALIERAKLGSTVAAPAAPRARARSL